MSIAISIENLYACYKDRVVIKDFSYSIKEGSFLTILGPNGSGKTTLLSVIVGIKKIHSGTVRIFGKEVNSKNVGKLRSLIGYVPQNIFFNQRFPINVFEVVLTGRLGLKFLKKIKKEDKEIAEWAMEMVGIRDLKERPIGHLSGGELKKVFIARALCQMPKILLLDEPTSHLDPNSQKALVRLIEELYYKNKITTVFVTHLISHIPKVCDEVIFMEDGNLLFQGKMDESKKFLSQISEIKD